MISFFFLMIILYNDLCERAGLSDFYLIGGFIIIQLLIVLLMAADSLGSHGSSDHSSMSSSSRGYDRGLFVDEPPLSLQCPACNLTLRDPHLLSCCGAHICEV